MFSGDKSFPALNGLRALFLFWVMFVHMPQQLIWQPILEMHEKWGLGVDGFLAMSGFLVARSLEQCHVQVVPSLYHRRNTFFKFILKRGSRILPSYYLILSLLGLFAYFSHNSFHQDLAAAPISSLIGLPLFFANYTIPWANEHFPLVFQTYWSISFQEQYYLFLATLYFAFGYNRVWMRNIILSGCLLSIFIRIFTVFYLWAGQEGRTGHRLQVEFHFAFDSIGWGTLAWLYYEPLSNLWRNKRRAYFLNTFLFIALFVTISARSYWDGVSSLAVLATLKAPLLTLLIISLTQMNNESVIIQFLNLKPLKNIGLASYEIYLVHVIIYWILLKISFLNHGRLFFLTAYPTTILIGYFIHIYFGKPIQSKIMQLDSSAL